jgi:hypothetical protein
LDANIDVDEKIHKEELIRTIIASQHGLAEGSGWGEGRLQKTLLMRNNSLYMVDHDLK